MAAAKAFSVKAATDGNVPFAVTQAPARARQRAAVKRLLDDVQGTAEVWKERDPDGMADAIAINLKLAVSLAQAFDAMPSPLAPPTPGLSKATPRKHTPKNGKKNTTRDLKNAARHCGK
jgi:hypothetical protein